MPTFSIGRPEQSEYAPHAKAYVALVPGDNPIAALSAQVEKTLALFAGVDENHASEWSYEPGKWTIKQVLGHLSDTERIFAYRALRVSRGDETPLPGFEQDPYVVTAKSNVLPLKQLVEEFRTVRSSTLALAGGLPEEAWSRRGAVSNAAVSVRGIFFTAAGHELHHYKILRERYQLGL